MKKTCKNIIIFVLIFVGIITSIAYSAEVIEVDRDKKGRILEYTIKPTAATTINPDTISDAASRVRGVDSKAGDRTNNIISNGILLTKNIVEEPSKTYEDKGYTLIRHTPSIANVDKYEILHDSKTNRIKLKIKEVGMGERYAANGFYKVDGKTFYFDENGLMVLGPAYDTVGNYYYFSKETGELIEEIQTK